MAYSRATPSPRYIALLEQYRILHVEGDPTGGVAAGKMFPGQSLFMHARSIKRLIQETGAQNILDYGSGKGLQYSARPYKAPDGSDHESIQEYWDVDFIQCYDPCYEPFSVLPAQRFDGVISTDVLEHCPEDDIPWILEEMFGLAKRFLFANVACYAAQKHLPNGENAHATIKPPTWWKEVLEATAPASGLVWEVELREPGRTLARFTSAIAERR
jgi:hypothetical protein